VAQVALAQHAAKNFAEDCWALPRKSIRTDPAKKEFSSQYDKRHIRIHLDFKKSYG
jgi:hypothetical protein